MTKTICTYECVTKCVQVPCTTTRIVCEPCTTTVPVCKTRIVCEPCTTTVNVCVAKCVPYQATRTICVSVPTCVTEMVTKCVAKVVEKQVFVAAPACGNGDACSSAAASCGSNACDPCARPAFGSRIKGIFAGLKGKLGGLCHKNKCAAATDCGCAAPACGGCS